MLKMTVLALAATVSSVASASFVGYYTDMTTVTDGGVSVECRLAHPS